MALGSARIKNVFGPLSAKACPAPGSRCRELQLTISLIFLIDEGVAGLVDSWRIGTAMLAKNLARLAASSAVSACGEARSGAVRKSRVKRPQRTRNRTAAVSFAQLKLTFAEVSESGMARAASARRISAQNGPGNEIIDVPQGGIL